MQITCNLDGCTKQPTGVILVPDWPDRRWDVIGHCDDHAPEIMHELIADGNVRSQMVTCTIDKAHAVTHNFGPRTLRDNIGQRVEVASHLDLWMRGDRYGMIVGVHGINYGVLMDRSNTLQILAESEVRFLPTVALSDGTAL